MRKMPFSASPANDGAVGVVQLPSVVEVDW